MDQPIPRRDVDGFARVNELAETLSETRPTYIADREGDIYEPFVEAPSPEHGADWLVRGQHHERRLSDGRKLIEALEEAPVLSEISFDRPAAQGRPARTVTQALKAVRVTLKAPYRPERALPPVTITALLARERPARPASTDCSKTAGPTRRHHHPSDSAANSRGFHSAITAPRFRVTEVAFASEKQERAADTQMPEAMSP